MMVATPDPGNAFQSAQSAKWTVRNPAVPIAGGALAGHSKLNIL
jgi:hypothetical protein